MSHPCALSDSQAKIAQDRLLIFISKSDVAKPDRIIPRRRRRTVRRQHGRRCVCDFKHRSAARACERKNNELAIRIHSAERFEPKATAQIAVACNFLHRRSQAKIHTPRNTDSRKKTSSVAMAKGAPKMSPTKREYSDQFMPSFPLLL